MRDDRTSSLRARRRVVLPLASLLLLSGCRGGINAGGERCPDCGGVAFIAMAGMLIAIAVILWFILGRED